MKMKKKYQVLLFLGIFVFTAMGSPVWASDTTSGEPVISPKQADPGVEQEGFEDDLFEEYQNGGEHTVQVADPIYYFNYAMYEVNDKLYFWVLKPLAKGYKAVVPTPARTGIRNFFHNLMFPVRFANNLFQGKLTQASDEIGIFLVNSTAGILGFTQPAQKYLGMRTQTEDLGQTLGSYKIKEGFYLVLPVLGPSTFRDLLGRAGDYFITPVNYAEPWELEWGLDIVDMINRTSFHIGDYEALKKAALDPYTAIRNAYIQNRRQQIKN